MATIIKQIWKKGEIRRSCDIVMIFVTVATHFQGFERLIKEIDIIAKKIDEKVIAQIGNTKYIPKNMEYFTFTEDKKILDLYKTSRVIITHAGAGTLLTLFNYKKHIIVVPRLKRFNEVIDDHQLELAEVLQNKKNVTVIYDIKELENALKKQDELDYVEITQKKELVIFLKNILQEMAGFPYSRREKKRSRN